MQYENSDAPGKHTPATLSTLLSGIFWVILDDLSFGAYSLLVLDATAPPTSRKGNSHTHQAAWALRGSLFHSHPLYHTHIKQHVFDFYPRGRVELRTRNGETCATIWLNPDIHRPEILGAVRHAFCLMGCRVDVKEDHSRHYRHRLLL